MFECLPNCLPSQTICLPFSLFFLSFYPPHPPNRSFTSTPRPFVCYICFVCLLVVRPSTSLSLYLLVQPIRPVRLAVRPNKLVRHIEPIRLAVRPIKPIYPTVRLSHRILEGSHNLFYKTTFKSYKHPMSKAPKPNMCKTMKLNKILQR